MSSVADIPQFLRVAGALNLTIGFVGAHGRGKTATVNQFGDAYGYEDVIVCNASQWAPEDMLGLPMRVKNDKADSRAIAEYAMRNYDKMILHKTTTR